MLANMVSSLFTNGQIQTTLVKAKEARRFAEKLITIGKKGDLHRRRIAVAKLRDKDAVTASLLLTEMAAWYQSQGMTLFDALQALYEKYGYYGEKTHNLVMPGLDGLEKMAALMKNLRDVPPTEIAGVAVTARTDYKDGTITDCTTGQVTASELKGSNVLRYTLADGTVILVRPSGTEPKIKIYILTRGKDAAERDANLVKYSAWVETLVR